MCGSTATHQKQLRTTCPGRATLIDRASKLAITMDNAIDTSGLNRSTAQGKRLWNVLAVSGLLLVIMGGLAAWLPWHRRTQAIARIHLLGKIDTEPVGPEWFRSDVGSRRNVSSKVMRGFDRVVSVDFDSNVTDAELAPLSGITELRFLRIDRRTLITDAGLVHLKPLEKLERLSLIETSVTDAGLIHLKGLTELRRLNLSGTQVTGTGLVHLRMLRKLEELNLSSTQVTNEGLARLLKSLPVLRELNLWNTQVTDAGLVHLTGLTNLEHLSLNNTSVSDAGLVHLKGLTNLEYLSLNNTSVTRAGANELQASLLNCKIIP